MFVKKSVCSIDILLPALEQAMDAIVLIDDEYNVLFFNNQAESLWGINRHEVIGRQLAIPGIRIADQGKGMCAEPVGKRYDVQITHKDGQRIWVSLALSNIEAGGKYYSMG